MNYSIAETLLIKHLFKRESKALSLRTLVQSNTSLQETALLTQFLSSNLSPEHPLIFFLDLLRDLSRILKESSISLTLNKHILRLETILAWHFDNNFKGIQSSPCLLNEYSVNSLYTLIQFMNVFEYQNIITSIEHKYLALDDFFCTNKVYYFYLDLIKKDKINYGNIVDFILTQLDSKVEQHKSSKANNNKIINYQLEQYIMMSLFALKKIIVEYSFYFSKMPEFSKIYQQLEKYTQ